MVTLRSQKRVKDGEGAAERAKREAMWLAAGVGAIAGALLVLAALILVTADPRPNTLPYEVVRICLQVFGVVLITAFVGLATFQWQQVRLEQSKLQAEQRDEIRKKDAADRDLKVDQRHRLDERVRAFFEETLQAYHGVKQVRRLLAAETGSAATPSISLEAYSRLIPELSGHQLTFESLKRRAPLIQSLVPGADTIPYKADRTTGATGMATLEKHYEVIEKYLNHMVDDYEKRRGALSSEHRHLLRDLQDDARLSKFIFDTVTLKVNVTYRVEAVLGCLERALLRPLDLREAGERLSAVPPPKAQISKSPSQAIGTARHGNVSSATRV
jgi:hypothetical protein